MKPGLQDVNQINEGTGVHWEAIICYGLAILFIITILTLITIWLLEYIEKRWNKHHDKEDDYDKHVKTNSMIRRIGISFSISKKNIVQEDLFSNSNIENDDTKLEEALLNIKKKYGNNSILRAVSFTENATARDRNKLIGGHNAE
jgi:hypothetical protein